jgi:hypothetical protein
MLESGQHLGIAIYSARLAEMQARAGFVRDALATIDQAVRQDFNEPVFRPEILNIRGELSRLQGQAENAERDFRQAIALAHSMSAKAFELRSTLSLARLLANQNRRDEARSMLVEIYNWFTEGFDTADLKEAKALLDELNR